MKKKIRKGNIYNPIILGIFALFVEEGRGRDCSSSHPFSHGCPPGSRTDIETRITAH